MTISKLFSFFKLPQKAEAAMAAPNISTEAPDSWILCVGDTELGLLTFDSYEFPWIHCQFTANEEFAMYKRYFTDSETWSDDDEEIEALCGSVHAAGGMRLINRKTMEVSSKPIINFLEDGTYAWFRN